MKVLPFQIPKPANDALIYQEDYEYVFYDKLHQHEEIQLSFIAEGEGTLVVGDTISNYKKGDVLAFDGNLPHVFKSEPNPEQKSLMLTLFFTRNSFGDDFFDLEELSEIQSFFTKLVNGFKVTSHKTVLEDAFISLKESSKLERFVILLRILKIITKAKKQSLSSFIYKKSYSANEGKRMRDVMNYTMNQYDQSISLEKIAEVASMTKNAFCKYFKKRTNKTYIQFLTELRIENACKLLVNKKELPVSEIAYQCGFGNLSNFNRQFKEIKGKTPSNYRAMH
ncbi:AraC family transcriptional regulator [Pseudotenacibaculum sp. MALMAid0570]|uniref:AraC family transcriptional regulator n=1 Tax=Pseudotenacibaculum sp. MALMAid0570 TaxID=3143938 RepID=UPI0032DEAB6D